MSSRWREGPGHPLVVRRATDTRFGRRTDDGRHRRTYRRLRCPRAVQETPMPVRRPPSARLSTTAGPMPPTVNRWPRSMSLTNLRAIARARRGGATVSYNQVKVADSAVGRNAVMEHALLWGSEIGRYAIVGR